MSLKPGKKTLKGRWSKVLCKFCETNDYYEIIGNHDVYRLVATSAEERDEWIKCIEVNLRHSSVYDSMTQRRRKITGIKGLDIPEIN